MTADSETTGSPGLAKAPTGIGGLDEITQGGLPAGRPTLVCGGSGCGKTVLAMEFLVHGARRLGEPGLFVSFEEKAPNLIANFCSVGLDLAALIEARRLKVEHVDMAQGEIVETGPFSLDALRIRLEHGLAEVGATRLALDGMESVVSALPDSRTLRAEMARFLQWLRDRGITVLITGERGAGTLTRFGFEEHISDCVLLLDHRVTEQISKRRLRVVKYRGSAHAVDEFPFLIGRNGISVLPITSAHLDHEACSDRVSTGVPDLDAMLGGRGYFRGATVLVSGKAGTGKSTLAAAFAAAACGRAERCLYLALEESAPQLARNMRSVGIDLDPWIRAGSLAVLAFRPTFRGLEEHLVAMTEAVCRLNPSYIVIDPITNFVAVGTADDVRSMLTRFIDHLKGRGATMLFTALTAGSGRPDETETSVSSLVDTWIALDLTVVDHDRRRELYVVKSRGMEHSRQTRELVMSAHGLSVRAIRPEVEP